MEMLDSFLVREIPWTGLRLPGCSCPALFRFLAPFSPPFLQDIQLC